MLPSRKPFRNKVSNCVFGILRKFSEELRRERLTIAHKQEAIYGVSSHEINLILRGGHLAAEWRNSSAAFNEHLISSLHKGNSLDSTLIANGLRRAWTSRFRCCTIFLILLKIMTRLCRAGGQGRERSFRDSRRNNVIRGAARQGMHLPAFPGDRERVISRFPSVLLRIDKHLLPFHRREISHRRPVARALIAPSLCRPINTITRLD